MLRLLLFYFILNPLWFYGQEIQHSEKIAVSDRGDLIQIRGIISNNLIASSASKNQAEVYIFKLPHLDKSKVKTIKIDHRRAEIISQTVYKKRFVIFFKSEEGGQAAVYARIYSSQFKLQQTKLIYVLPNIKGIRTKVSYSQDKSQITVTSKYVKYGRQSVIYKVNPFAQNSQLEKFEFKKGPLRVKDILISDQGELCIISHSKTEDSKPYMNEIHLFWPINGEEKLISKRGITFYPPLIKFKNGTNELHGFGFYSSQSDYRQSLEGFWRYSLDSLTFTQVVSDSFSRIKMPYNEESRSILTEFKPQTIILRKDGGILVFAERISYTNARRAGTDPMEFSKDTPKFGAVSEYNEVVGLNISPKNKFDWEVILYKRQSGVAEGKEYTSFFQINSGASLALLYNSTIEIGGQLMQFLVHGNGVSKNQVILNNSKINTLPMPKYTFQSTAKTLYIPCMFRNEFSILKVSY